jgi:hypothetical protein
MLLPITIEALTGRVSTNMLPHLSVSTHTGGWDVPTTANLIGRPNKINTRSLNDNLQ